MAFVIEQIRNEMRHTRVMIAAMSIATLAACTSEEPRDENEPSASPVRMKVQSPSDYIMGKAGPIVLEMENNGPSRKSVDITLSLSLKNAPKGDISVEYQGIGSSSWKDLRLSPSTTGNEKHLSGTYQAPLPSGNSTLRLRLTPGMRPTDSGQSIGITAKIGSTKGTLISARGSAPLTNLQVSMESGADYVQRKGDWSEYAFSVNNRSAFDYPKIQILTFLCEETEGDCRSDESTSTLSIQWKTRGGWKDLDNPLYEPPSTSEPLNLEDGAVLDTDIPLPRDGSRRLTFRIKETGEVRKGEWQGEVQVLARHKGDKSTTALSTANAALQIK